MTWWVPLLQAGVQMWGANQAAGATGDATDAQIAEARRQFDAIMGREAPMIDARNTAMNSLLDMSGLPGLAFGQPGQSPGQPSGGAPSNGGPVGYGGGNGGGTTQMPSPVEQPQTGSAGSTRPGAIGSARELSNHLATMYGTTGNAPRNYNLTTEAPTNFEGGDAGDIALGMMLGGPAGAAMAYGMGGENVPVEPAETGPGILNVWGDTPDGFQGVPGSGGEWLNPAMLNGANAPRSGDLTAGEVDLAAPTTGSSTVSGNSGPKQPGPPTISHQSGISYGGNPGLSPEAAAIINRRIQPGTVIERRFGGDIRPGQRYSFVEDGKPETLVTANGIKRLTSPGTFTAKEPGVIIPNRANALGGMSTRALPPRPSKPSPTDLGTTSLSGGNAMDGSDMSQVPLGAQTLIGSPKRPVATPPPGKNSTPPDQITVPDGYAASTGDVVAENPGGTGDNNFRAAPGYNFRFDEGQRAVESSAAGRGMLLSGRTLKELTRFGQGIGSAEYDAEFARRAAIAGLGYQGSNSLNNAQMYTSGQVNNAIGQAGAANSSAYINYANAANNALNNGMYLYGQYGG